jgi:CHAT domain-containing protein
VDGWVVRYYGFQAAMQQAQQTKKEEDKETANQAWQAWLDTMEATLGDLYQRLLDPVHQRLKEREQKTGERIERVVMVPNRGLAILPLHACWWEKDGRRRYLLDDYVITYAPSLSVFKRCLERERAGRSKQTLLGIANPKPPGNLVFSEWECEEIERLLGDERCLFLWGEQATKAEMMRWVGERHWLHFSCHGQYRLDAPLESSLSLAQGDKLTLGEILEKLDLQHTWLTVLSACETGLVDFREIADEHYGLPLGFLFAGAPTVWGTLWTVNDLTTALLIREAYQNLIGENAGKPEALREAQRWLRDAKAEELLALISNKQAALGYDRMAWYHLSPLRRDVEYGYEPQACPYSHPYFWAGMQCVGV